MKLGGSVYYSTVKLISIQRTDREYEWVAILPAELVLMTKVTSVATTELRSYSNDIPHENQKDILVQDITHINLTQGNWEMDMFPVQINCQIMMEIFADWKWHIQQEGNNST